MVQRRVPAGTGKFGISDRGGLSAGRKRRSPKYDDKRLKDVPDTSGRVGNMICLNGPVRVIGIIDGHVASPIPAPNLSRTRNEGRTVAGRDQAWHQTRDFMQV